MLDLLNTHSFLSVGDDFGLTYSQFSPGYTENCTSQISCVTWVVELVRPIASEWQWHAIYFRLRCKALLDLAASFLHPALGWQGHMEAACVLRLTTWRTVALLTCSAYSGHIVRNKSLYFKPLKYLALFIDIKKQMSKTWHNFPINLDSTLFYFLKVGSLKLWYLVTWNKSVAKYLATDSRNTDIIYSLFRYIYWIYTQNQQV